MDKVQEHQKRLTVTFELVGEEAIQFQEYKREMALKTKAAAAYKLVIERLREVRPAAA